MKTIGYGDIVPVTTNKKILAIFSMLLATIVFSYTLNSMNFILK